jgi:hypothetical protein
MEASDQPIPKRSWPRRMLNRMEVDRAVFYAVAARGWQFVAGPVSMLLIAMYFSPDQQGYFYTFASLMALHALVELGLHGVIIIVASHEWSRLSLDSEGRVVGDADSLSRLSGVRRFAFAWYGTLSALFVTGVGIGGYAYFRSRPSAGVAWEGPWIALVLFNGVLIWLWSLSSILEGCNQVATVNRFRFGQSVAGNIVVWPGIVLGLGLWVAVMSAVTRLVWEMWLVSVKYGRFFQSLWRQDAGTSLKWKDDVWPLQWRSGARSIAAYFALQIFTPVMFHYHGPEAAGRMGMTWTALTALEAAAFAWLQTRGPLFGMLVAQRQFAELDRIFFRLATISCVVLAAGGAAVSAVVALLPLIPLPLAAKLSNRLLSFEATALFVAGLVILNFARCLGLYVLVHKRDPFLVPGLVSSAATAILVWYGGKTWGAEGAAVGYVTSMAVAVLPAWWLIWRTCRHEWH